MQDTGLKSAANAAGSGKWYYVNGGKKNGPVDASALLSMIKAGTLPPTTRVWTSGMEGWTPASDTALLNDASAPAKAPAAKAANAAGNEAPKRKSRWWIWLIVILLVFIIAAAAVGGYFLFFRGDGASSATEQPLVYGLSDPIIFENDECSFVIDAIGEKGDYLELDVRCVNKTGDLLTFCWDSVCINGSMFDPLWFVSVQANSTMKSSITFPLSALNGYNLLPADQIKFVLRVHNEHQYNALLMESGKYILHDWDVTEDTILSDYKTVEGYGGYLFTENVLIDKDGRPYYVSEDETNVYFDEIYDQNGNMLYAPQSDDFDYGGFYDDSFGRPYYFTNSGETIYYDGYGFAFYDEDSEKYYFFDEYGKPAHYGNGGIPEYYEEEVSESMLDEEKPESLAKAGGCYIVHKEFTLYPTGKTAEEVNRPNRVTASSELVYWNGEKGSFIVLGGEMDEFKGYIVHTYVQNDSDGYVYFGWNDVVVNGVDTYPDSITVLRPHSSAYRDILIPAELLKTNKIKTVERIDFCVYASGENLSVPLYPIEWEAVALAGLKK